MTLMIRPDSWNLPVLVHVAGAMALVASITVVAVVLVQGWRTSDAGTAAALQRFGARTLLFAVLPSYFVMRGAAEWALSRENLSNSNASWIGIGFGVADFGGLLLLIAVIIANIGSRRSREGGMSALTKAATVISVLLVVAYIVAIWAMTTKPS
ncbi:MAG TPA: hypothetical protein VHL51_14315 [Gaiellales bacterium]|jgi:hypothetical protein|nr:hypothetical protein [Gaiellales bacterium]